MALSGTITGTGATGKTTLGGLFNLSLSGFGTATVDLERSTDGGVTWGAVKSYTSDAEETGESSGSPQYRLNCTAYTSGTIVYRLSQ